MRLLNLALATALIAPLGTASAQADQPPPEEVRDAARAALEAVFGLDVLPIDPAVEAGRLANRTAVHTDAVEDAQAARAAAEAAAHEEWHRQQEAALTAQREQPGKTVWDRLAKCESGGVWNINTGNGYFGGLQFSLSSWRATGGSGYPHQSSRAEQIKRAEILLEMQGWGAWPACSRKLGLR